MNDALSYNQDLDDALARRGIEHTSETPPIEDLPIRVNMSGASIDFKKYAEFGTHHLTHWFQLLEEWHPRHVCVVVPDFYESIHWFKESEPAKPVRLKVYAPHELKHLEPGFEFYDPKKHREIYTGMIDGTKYYVPTWQPGFIRVAYQAAKGGMSVVLPADPGRRAGEIVIPDVDRFRRQLARCHGKKPRARFQVFPLFLIITEEDTHANMIVIDTVKRTITRFEPHGANVDDVYDPRDIDGGIRRVLVPVVESALGISIERVITPSDFCPADGLQTTELLQKRYPAQYTIVSGEIVKKEKGGYCDAWSAMWLHYRILNPNKSDKQVYDMIHAGWDDLATKIRAYVTAIVTSFMEKLAKEKEESLRGR